MRTVCVIGDTGLSKCLGVIGDILCHWGLLRMLLCCLCQSVACTMRMCNRVRKELLVYSGQDLGVNVSAVNANPVCRLASSQCLFCSELPVCDGEQL